MTQFALAFFGLTAMWLAMGRDPRGRRWAPIVGLCGQPAWLVASWEAGQWGMFIVSVGYTILWLDVARKQWWALWTK